MKMFLSKRSYILCELGKNCLIKFTGLQQRSKDLYVKIYITEQRKVFKLSKFQEVIMSNRIDTIMKEFIGRRFSTFTVDSLCEEKNKWREYMWNCVCDCGYVKQLPSSYIKKGFTVDCPVCGTKSSAYKQDVLLNKKSHFIDKRFGEWTVIGLGDTLSSKSGRLYQSWTCRFSFKKFT